MMLLTLLSKMIACSGILFGYYWLFLRNKKFHHYNRFYLLAASCMSIIFPFIRIPVSAESESATGQLVTRSIGIISVNRWEDEITGSSASKFLASWLTLPNIFLVIYAMVILFLLCILTRSMIYIYRLSSRYPCEHIYSFKLYNTTEPGTPFSFFKSIFWNTRLDVTSREGQQIFRHELFHVRQQHSIDIIFLELISIFFWINPFFHLVKKEIKAIHEFLADQHAIEDNDQHAYAELLILQSLNLKKSSITNYFFQNHIKRRITMITQFKTKTYSYWSRLLVLPLGIFLFCAIALYAQNGGSTIKKPAAYSVLNKATKSIKVVVDAGHGGSDAGVRGNGLEEKDISLAIAKQIKHHASSYNIDVVMTREDDNNATLKERSALAIDVKADLLVSIHVGAAVEGTTQGGFDIYVTNRNQATLANSKLLGQNIAGEIKQLYTVGPIKQRKEQGIWILDAVPAPAVLIECGYMTNPQDVAFITDSKNQELLAKKILDGISRYSNDPGTIISDTIPNKKKSNTSANVQLSEDDGGTQDRIALDKKIQSQRREAEIARRKMSEAQVEMKTKRQKMAELDRSQQKLAKMQNDLDARQVHKMKMQGDALVQKQQEYESRQRKLENEIRSQADELEKKVEQLNMQEKIFEQKRVEEMQKQQQLLLEKQQALDLDRKELRDARMAEIENDYRIIKEKQGDREPKPAKPGVDKMEKSQEPAKKSPGDAPRKPKPVEKVND